MLNCVFVTFLCGILGQVLYLIVSIPDICPFYYIVPSNMHCISSNLFMFSFENIVVRQRSNFIQFIHISFKDPQYISSAYIIIGICFGVRVLVMIPLMFVHYALSYVWVAEWPPFEK